MTVANPLSRWLSFPMEKTDGDDTLNLARLLAAGLITSVWALPDAVGHLLFGSHRQRLMRRWAEVRNRLQRLLH